MTFLLIFGLSERLTAFAFSFSVGELGTDSSNSGTGEVGEEGGCPAAFEESLIDAAPSVDRLSRSSSSRAKSRFRDSEMRFGTEVRTGGAGGAVLLGLLARRRTTAAELSSVDEGFAERCLRVPSSPIGGGFAGS